MPTPQVPAYASPATSGYLRRSARLADAIESMRENRNPAVYNSALGSYATLLSDALNEWNLGHQQEKAEAGVKADMAKLSDALFEPYPDSTVGVMRTELNSPNPINLKPEGYAERDKRATLGKAMRTASELTGDPMGALRWGQEQERYDQERQDELSKPVIGAAGAGGYVRGPGGQYSQVFSVPAPGAGTGGNVHSVIVDENGIPHVIPQAFGVDPKVLDFKAQNPLQFIDVGGVPATGNRRSGEVTPVVTPASVAQNAGVIEAGKAAGKSQAEAIKTLPEAISTSDRAIASIDELLNSKGFNWAYGIGRANPAEMIPGSDRKNTEAIRAKLDGQFFVAAITAMQVSLAPVSDADALRLVASVSQLTNADISPEEARRAGEDLKDYFQKAKAKASAAADRGPMSPEVRQQVTGGATAPGATPAAKPQIAVNPQTGEKMVFNPLTKSWVPAR